MMQVLMFLTGLDKLMALRPFFEEDFSSWASWPTAPFSTEGFFSAFTYIKHERKIKIKEPIKAKSKIKKET